MYPFNEITSYTVFFIMYEGFDGVMTMVFATGENKPVPALCSELRFQRFEIFIVLTGK